MSSNLLIHIGTGKTGTTSLQKALHTAARQGRLGTVCYPLIADDWAHHQLANSVRPVDRLSRMFVRRYQSDPELKEEHDREAQQALRLALDNHKNVVISSEFFSSLTKAEILAFHTMLQEWGYSGKVHLVAYVRDPVDYYTSIVQQTCKASSTIPPPETYHYNCRRFIQMWQNVFSVRATVRAFDKSSLIGNDAISDFSAVCAEAFNQPMPALQTVAVNKSLSLEALTFLQNYRHENHPTLDGVPTADTHQVLEVLSLDTGVFETQLELRRKVKAIVYQQHEKDIDWLFEKFDIDFRREVSAVSQQTYDVSDRLLPKDVFLHYDEPKYQAFAAKVMNKLILHSK